MNNGVINKGLTSKLNNGRKTMITKEQAIYNVTKAYLEYKVFGRLFWDDRSGDIDVRSQTQRDYYKADARFDAMGAAYMDAGLISMG
jgi:hypothetical protein